MGWQKTFTLPRQSKGCHLVTDSVLAQISEGIENVEVGMLFLFIQHTSAALSINENYDPGEYIIKYNDPELTIDLHKDVRRDMDMALDTIVPESLKWMHTDEGPEVSHTKASLIGSTISVPITNGHLNLGTWQGIYLTEFRHAAHTRRVVATVL
ncbi:hypothetical protein PAXINDRAFT_63764 [Paxillus involutus ATCC 200175]|nr:hypothetical protein PAXINDRAFT_63764 [Paxillus involutus ATCC 200175]